MSFYSNVGRTNTGHWRRYQKYFLFSYSRGNLSSKRTLILVSLRQLRYPAPCKNELLNFWFVYLKRNKIYKLEIVLKSNQISCLTFFSGFFFSLGKFACLQVCLFFNFLLCMNRGRQTFTSNVRSYLASSISFY